MAENTYQPYQGQSSQTPDNKKKWILLSILAFVLILGLIYYFFFSKNSTAPVQTPMPQTNTSPSATQTPPATNNTNPTPVSNEPQPMPIPPPAATTTTVSIDIKNFVYTPTTVTIKKGTTVVWKNFDSAPHDIAADDGSLKSPTMNLNGTYSHTFNTTGTFKYHCSFHPGMKATIIITN